MTQTLPVRTLIDVTFQSPTDNTKRWPKNKRAEVTIRFTDGWLGGCLIDGITVWDDFDKQTVTCPGVKTKAGRYFDFLRAFENGAKKTMIDFILTEVDRAAKAHAG